MNASPAVSVVLFVANVQRMSAFYQGVFGMALLHGDQDHEVLGIGGFELVIHRLRGEAEPAKDARGTVVVREDAYTKLCLPVLNIATARKEAEILGGHIRPPKHEWEARGFRACDGNDPEGNVLQARQSAA